MNKKVIYTCLTGGYDKLVQPLAIDESFDYICFSNDISANKVGVWEIRKIPFETDDNIILSRYVKILPHTVLQDYEYSLWMDANIQISGKELYEIINKKIAENALIYQVNHCLPYCDCVYDEMGYAFSLGRTGLAETLKQYRHLMDCGFPKHWGLYENNILLRQHNEAFVQNISEEWWAEYIKYTKRDQFSLSFIYWRSNYKPELLLPQDKNSRNVPFLKWHYHVAKTPTLFDKVLFQVNKGYRLLTWKICILLITNL